MLDGSPNKIDTLLKLNFLWFLVFDVGGYAHECRHSMVLKWDIQVILVCAGPG